MKLYIVRGPSGSGKSTIANKIRENSDSLSMVFEADNFFHDVRGEYNFQAKLLGKAHQWNVINVEKVMFSGVPNVIVSNTSMTIDEMGPYIQLAEKYGYELKVFRTPGPWDLDTLYHRNLHNVPLETIQRQINRYEEYPGEQEWT